VARQYKPGFSGVIYLLPIIHKINLANLLSIIGDTTLHSCLRMSAVSRTIEWSSFFCLLANKEKSDRNVKLELYDGTGEDGVAPKYDHGSWIRLQHKL
jgi:hypothetical protein